MSETAFPVNDLLRRKLQTGLTLCSLTASVAATLFLLLFNDQISSGINSVAQTSLTLGLSIVFGQFLLFVGILVFAVGAVIVSIIVYLMMAQRTRDFGLMKATGCPNGLVFGFFFTELLLVTTLGCLLGIALGFAADYAVINLGGFQAYQNPPNIWFAPLVFAAFFIFALIFGAKPMLDAARMSPVKAISPLQYFGLSKGNRFKALPKSQLTFKIASRSLFRRQAATIRIIVFLSIVFILLTVSIAGSIIARDTTGAWVENAIGKDTILVAHSKMSTQYTMLLSKFSGAKETNTTFNYLDPEIAISDNILEQLSTTPEIGTVDPRLICKTNIQEVSNFTIDPETSATIPVGDHREAEALVVGVDPQKTATSWFVKGRFFNTNNALEAVVGDTTAQILYSPNSTQKISLSDPLLQSVRLQNATFRIVGVCVDPINNGMVVYVPLSKLENITGFSSPNVVLIQLDPSANHAATLALLQERLRSADSDLTAVDLNSVLQKNMDFLGSIWSAVILLPLFCLAAAAFSLIGFLVIAINEQHQEFAVLRAIGIKPRTVLTILTMQSLIVLLSSFAVGISLGTIITVLILMREPLVTSFTILQIAGWLLAALVGMFLLSLYPAVQFSRKSLLKLIS
jgi:ABC-type antimicrobial peptide transport system permease subunit